MKKMSCVLSFLFLLLVCGCDSDSLLESSSQIVAVGLHNEWEGLDSLDEIIFTGDDVLWFDGKTNELRFKKNPFENNTKVYKKILFKIAGMDLFLVDIVSGAVNATYPDMVLYHNLENNRFYLWNSYPKDMETEEVRLNVEIRSENWNAFIYQLSREGRLKE